jgi:hypothetical protein
MKKIITLILTCFLFIGKFYAQSEDIVYKITNYEINGENYDQVALEENIALTFYKDDNGNFCFANVFRNADTQSYGRIYGFTRKFIEETAEQFAHEDMQFTWDFANSYDEVKGKASVSFSEIYIGQTIKINVEIVVMDTNEILLLKGYQEQQ